jgi:hypothetical protein
MTDLDTRTELLSMDDKTPHHAYTELGSISQPGPNNKRIYLVNSSMETIIS